MPLKRFRKGTYDSYYRKKMMKRRGRYGRKRTASFKTRVRRVLMGKAETKKYQFADENIALNHNLGFNSGTAIAPKFASSDIFFNIWADIAKGTARHQRIGDRITPRGMSLKIYLAAKDDRPNTMYRIIVARAPKAINGVATTRDSISDPFDQLNLGNLGSRLLLPLDKDRGIKALYDKVIRPSNQSWGGGIGTGAGHKEQTKYLKLWFRNRKARDIVYDSTNSDQIVNNPVLLWVIPYEEYGTLETDVVATIAFHGTLYYKDV